MNKDDFNLMKIVKAETNIALPALKEVFETQWNKQYPEEKKWSYDAASVTLFDQKENELFERNLNGLSQSKRGKKLYKRNQFVQCYKDEEWKSGNWDISKLAYALIDSKLFRLDETDEAGIPISEHIAEIRNIRNRLAHQTHSHCSKKDSDDTLASLSKHIKAFEDLNIDVDKYVAMIECIRSDKAPMTPEECYKLQMDFEKLKFNNQIDKLKLEFLNQQIEQAHEENRKTCELHDKIQTIQVECAKEIEFMKGKYKDKIHKLQEKYTAMHAEHASDVKLLQRQLQDSEDKYMTQQAEHAKAIKYLTGKSEHRERELLSIIQALASDKLAQNKNVENKRLTSEDDANRHKECAQKKPPSLNNQNIQVRQSEISPGVIMRSMTKLDSQRNARSYERVVSSDINRGNNKNGSKRNAFSLDLLKLSYLVSQMILRKSEV